MRRIRMSSLGCFLAVSLVTVPMTAEPLAADDAPPGLETEMVRYEVFLNHPEAVSLALIAPREESLSLMEDFLPEDKDSSARGMFPGFHGYGASGEAEGQVVYTARAMAAAVEAGWQPARTVVFASWDAEEYGLVGSVEWGENRAEFLREHAIAYLNLDSAVTGGNLGVGGVPSLRDWVREVTASVPDPVRGGMIGDDWQKRLHETWAREAPVDLEGGDTFELQLDTLRRDAARKARAPCGDDEEASFVPDAGLVAAARARATRQLRTAAAG